MMRRFMLLLVAGAGFAAETKTAIEVSGPEAVGPAALKKGVEWHVVNRGAKAALKVSIASETVSLKAEPATISLAQFGSATVKLQLAAGATPPVKEASALVFFYTAADKILVERKLTVNVPQAKIAVAEVAGWQWRGFLSPFVSAPEVCAELPMSEALPEEKTAGAALAASSGNGAAKVKVKAGPKTDAQLCFIDPGPGTYTGEVAPVWNGRPLGTVKLKYSIADGPVLAIILAMFGVMTAWWLKRTLNVTRVTAGLRQRAASALQGFESKSAPTFAVAVANYPKLTGLSLQPSAAEFWKSVDTAAASLARWGTVKIDEKELKSVEDQLVSLENLGGEWVQFGRAQANLAGVGEAIEAAARSSRNKRPATFDGAPAFLEPVEAALAVMAVRPQDVASKRQTATALAGAGAEWVRLHDMVEDLDGSWKEEPAANASSTQKQHHATAMRQWRAIWSRLWMASKPEEIGSIAPLLPSLGAAVAAVDEHRFEEDLGGPRLQPAPMMPMPMPVPVEEMAARFRRTVETSERGLVIAGMVLAITAGMSTTYLGQPFGSVKNYIDLFLWGAGTKTGLDLLMPLVEQLASLIPRGAAKA